MSLQEFRDYVTNSGVDFDILSIEQKRQWRETFDRSRGPAHQEGQYYYYNLLLFLWYIRVYIRGVCVCSVISFMVFVMFFCKLS